MANNLIWENRSFYFMIDATQIPPVTGLVPDLNAGAPPVFDDIGVLGTAGCLDPQFNVLTSLGPDVRGCTYSGTNLTSDPMFVFEQFNGGRGTTVDPGDGTTSLQVPAAFDEGGNFIRVLFGPLTLCADSPPPNGDPGTCTDYHILLGSPAVDAGLNLIGSWPDLDRDFDGQLRPIGPAVDIGADEVP
jgi:hypothetical protein